MNKSNEFLKCDFNLPNYDDELAKAEDVVDKIKNNVKILEIEYNITSETHSRLFEHIIRILEHIGKLSIPAFNIENELEETYKIKYLHAPELGKKLWTDHYGMIHHPFNTLKNRCYKLLDDLDEMYFEKYKKHPPNWNPY
jgi:hypothetical protein